MEEEGLLVFVSDHEQTAQVPRTRRRTLVVTAAAASAALLLAAGALRGDGGLSARRAVPGAAVQLDTMFQSDFGLAPTQLTVSGMSCPGQAHNPYNGIYSFKGLTGERRPYYEKGDFTLYFDPQYDGGAGGKETPYGYWILSKSVGYLHPERVEHFDDRSEPDDPFADAVLQMSRSIVFTKPADPLIWSDYSQAAGAAPPAAAKWWVPCDGLSTAQDPHIQDIQDIQDGSVAPPVNVRGRWKPLYSAMPEQEVSLKHGKTTKTSTGGNFKIEGMSSLEMSGKVGLPLFGDEIKSEVKAEIKSHYKNWWEDEGSHSLEDSTTFKLPKEEGSVLWQWELVATTESGEEGVVQTKQFAFTSSAACLDRPRCYPGGNTDHWHYQSCVPGWEIRVRRFCQEVHS